MNPMSVDLKYYLSVLEKESEPQEVLTEINKIPSCEKLLWRKYRNLVWKITKKQPIHKLENFKNRGFHNYHLDHKVSIWYGYKNKLDPKMIGSIANLEFIHWKLNLRKSIKCNFSGHPNLQTVIFVD